MNFTGRWYIAKMEIWDEDYYNMEVKAYIKIDEEGLGEFQFGLIRGFLDGKIVDYRDENKFEFSWTGRDENEEVNGSGWLKFPKGHEDTVNGEFRFYQGDDSTFEAVRAI